MTTGDLADAMARLQKKKFPRARCPLCGCAVAVRRGRLALHGRTRYRNGCDGSGMSIELTAVINIRRRNKLTTRIARLEAQLGDAITRLRGQEEEAAS